MRGEDAEALKRARLATAPGERVLWAARVSRSRMPGFAVLKPAVALIAYVVAGAYPVVSDPEPFLSRWPFLAAIMIPVVALAGWLALALHDERRRTEGFYAVTERRVLILAADGAVRHDVSLDQADAFRRVGRTIHLGGEDAVLEQGRTDPDGGLARFDALPRLERLVDPEGVLALIMRTAGRAADQSLIG